MITSERLPFHLHVIRPDGDIYREEKWWECDVQGCGYKTKVKREIFDHYLQVHTRTKFSRAGSTGDFYFCINCWVHLPANLVIYWPPDLTPRCPNCETAVER